MFLLEEFKKLSDELYFVFSSRFHLVPYFVFGQRFVYSVYNLPLYFVFGLETFRVLRVRLLPYFVFGYATTTSSRTSELPVQVQFQWALS